MERGERPRTRSGQGKIITGGLAVILVVLMLVWWTSAQQLPVVHIPTPALPNPNGFDAFLSATVQLVDGNKIAFALESRHTGVSKDDHPYSLADKQKLVSENATSLALIHEGLNEEYVNPPLRSYSTALPYYARFRGLARFLAVEAAAKAGKGDYKGAVDANLDAVALGAQIPHGCGLIGGLVGNACQAIGRRSLYATIERLNAKQARDAVKRIERIREKQVPYWGILQEQKWADQASLLEIFRQRNGMQQVAQVMGAPIPAFNGPPFMSQFSYLIYSKHRIMRDYTEFIDGEIARAKQPYGARPPTPIPNDPVVQIMASLYGDIPLKFANAEAQNGLVELMLALRAYRLEHGSYPETLDALIPGCVPQLPPDPFAKSGTFSYHRSGSTCLLYSIGPDGKDDGASPIDTRQSQANNPNERFYVKPDSKGDIVAGKNLW